LVDQEVQLPVCVHSGPAKGKIEWRRPTRETLRIVLHALYAGYYAYGRRQVEPRRKVPGSSGTGRVVKDSGEWLVLLPGRLPAYITPQGYEANVARMAAGRQTAATPGAPRVGSALLSGLLRCGRCGGHHMTVLYHDGSGATRSAHDYVCALYQVNYGTGGSCQHIAAAALDAYVTSQVLEAVAPAVWRSPWPRPRTSGPCWASCSASGIERASYAADRARRQYQLAEPENRLVVRQLEAGWKVALAEAGRLEADYQRFTENSRAPSPLPSVLISRPWPATSRRSGRPGNHAGRP
jgi:hypothetical protein